MNELVISWIEEGNDAASASPAERLLAGTRLASARPSGEPWLATIKPLGASTSLRTLALSLGAQVEFSSELVDAFSGLCAALLEQCTQDELSEIAAERLARGNPNRAWSARANLLRVILPERLVPQAKDRILQLFRSTQPLG